MTDRPASWRMPSPKQMQQMAAAIGRKAPAACGSSPDEELPAEYWQALLEDPRAAAPSPTRCAFRRTLRLSRIPEHLLRVSCSRCGRTVEIQKADAVRLFGPDTVWRDVGPRLLDDTCTQRTGRHEEDGCWPSFDGM